MSRAIAVLVAFVVAALPSAAAACAACGFGEDQSRTAYIATTVFMSALPLILIFGFVFWMRKRTKQIQAEELTRRAGVTGPIEG